MFRNTHTAKENAAPRYRKLWGRSASVHVRFRRWTHSLGSVELFQVSEHLHGEEGESGSHNTPEQIVPCKYRRRVIRICIALVVPAQQPTVSQ